MSIQKQSVSTDRLLRVLGDKRRCNILEYLDSKSDTSVTLRELATHLAASGPPESDASVEGFAAELHHTHLPMLADVGMIEYDVEQHTAGVRNHPDVEVTCRDESVRLS